MKKLVFYVVVVVSILALAPSAVRADLTGSTINANITLQGNDDNGFYTVNVFNGPISVGGGFSNLYSFFRQDTFGGFSTASNQLTGNIGLTITPTAIELSFNGQAQPVELIGLFTGLPATVTSATESAAGFLTGVAEPLPNSFTDTSLTIEGFYFGFQPGTNTSQTDVLTFGTSTSTVPEPSSLVLMGTSLLGMLGMTWRKKFRQN